MANAGVEELVATLSSYERIVMAQIARIEKSDTNIFHERQLTQRKACLDMDVGGILLELSNKSLINPGKRRYWQTTAIGRKVEHYLINKKLAEDYPGLSRIIRR